MDISSEQLDTTLTYAVIAERVRMGTVDETVAVKMIRLCTVAEGEASHEFVVPVNVARMSQTLKNMIDDCEMTGETDDDTEAVPVQV